MEVTINGKKITLISTFHMTECGGSNTKEGNQGANFVIYDEPNENGDYETRVLYFRSEDLESIVLKPGLKL